MLFVFFFFLFCCLPYRFFFFFGEYMSDVRMQDVGWGKIEDTNTTLGHDHHVFKYLPRKEGGEREITSKENHKNAII